MSKWNLTLEEALRVALHEVETDAMVTNEHANSLIEEMLPYLAQWHATELRKAKAEALREAADALRRPDTGAGYDAWASGVGDWLRFRADELEGKCP